MSDLPLELFKAEFNDIIAHPLSGVLYYLPQNKMRRTVIKLTVNVHGSFKDF